MAYYNKSKKSYGTAGLKRCLGCGKILKTEEYANGYDYHLSCWLEKKGRR